jgi:hypothetical protein
MLPGPCMAYVSVSRVTAIAALIVIALAIDASAQSDTSSDGSRKNGGRTVTDGQSSTKIFNDAGHAAGRTEINSNGTTTVYDSEGRIIGYETMTTGSALIDEAEDRFPRSR